MTKPITGGCLCGAIRYECSAEPMMPGHCHCHACQKKSGGGHASVFMVPKAALKVTGEPRHYDNKADSGNTVTHGFCRDCGSSVLGYSSGYPELVGIHAGSLDDPGIFEPGMHIYTDRAHPWDRIDPGVANFAEMPDMPGA